MTGLLQDKVAIITGAASGIGRATAQLFARQAALSHYGRLNILHSNAFINRLGNALEITEADWDLVLNVDLKATWMLAHHALPSMLASGGGAIVITGSVHALRVYTTPPIRRPCFWRRKCRLL